MFVFVRTSISEVAELPDKTSESIHQWLVAKSVEEIKKASSKFSAQEIDLLERIRSILTDTASNEMKVGKIINKSMKTKLNHFGCLNHATNCNQI